MSREKDKEIENLVHTQQALHKTANAMMNKRITEWIATNIWSMMPYPYFIVILDTRTDYFFKVCENFQNALGYSEEELYSAPYQSFIAPEYIKATNVEKDRIIATHSNTNVGEFINEYVSSRGKRIKIKWSGNIKTINESYILTIGQIL